MTEDEAIAKRNQLVRDGFCVIPGVLPADLLARLKAYTDELLDRRVVDPKHRYQGSDFHVGAQRLAGTGRYMVETSPLVDDRK